MRVTLTDNHVAVQIEMNPPPSEDAPGIYFWEDAEGETHLTIRGCELQLEAQSIEVVG